MPPILFSLCKETFGKLEAIVDVVTLVHDTPPS